MEVLREAFPTLSQQEITAAFHRVAVQVAEARRKQPDGWDAALVRSKGVAAQTDARELWRTASAATRSSTRALLSEASAHEAAKGAAEAAQRMQAAEAELTQIAKLLARLPGGGDAAASLLSAPMSSDGRVLQHEAVAPTGTRVDLARQLETDISRAEALAEELAAQLASASQT